MSRVESRVNSLWNMRDEMKADQMRMQESLLLADEDRNRQFNNQKERFDTAIAQMAEFAEQFKAFREQFEENKQFLSQLTQVEERLKRDQAQVAELQRLAEERMQKEFEEFQAAEERRWRKHEVTWEHKWNEQGRTNSQQGDLLRIIGEQVKLHSTQLTELWETQQTLVRIESVETERKLAAISKSWEERSR